MRKSIKSISSIALFCMLMITSSIYSQGSDYIGPYKLTAPVEYTGEEDLVIEGLEFSNSDGRCLTLWNCKNVIIRNCKFKDVLVKVAVYANKSTNVLVTNCVFENVHGAFIAGSCEGDIKFEKNDVKNILGNLYGGSVFSDAVQFNTCSGPGNSISYNVIENIPGESSPEDVINLFNSNGNPESPIRIAGNLLRGGGPSRSGGGILLGDWGGSFQVAEDNILVNPGQYGMGIAGGHDMILRNNKIYAKQQYFTNVGLSICNWTIKESGASYNILVENNDINWNNKDGTVHTAWFESHMKKAFPDWQKASVANLDINENILPEVILNTGKL